MHFKQREWCSVLWASICPFLLKAVVFYVEFLWICCRHGRDGECSSN
jgi:hypothetical protein